MRRAEALGSEVASLRERCEALGAELSRCTRAAEEREARLK